MTEIIKIQDARAASKPDTENKNVPYPMPSSARTFFLRITDSANGHFCGEICNLLYEETIPFQGLDEAFLRMDQMMDELGCPQAATELRSFPRGKKQRADETEHATIVEMRAWRCKRYWDKGFMQTVPFQKPQLQIEVLYRQRASWQGRLTLMWPAKPQEQSFRSVLELMHLIHSAYQM